MDLDQLCAALDAMKTDLEEAITTATFNGRSYASGLAAKTALIRSARLINHLHETVKLSLASHVAARNLPYTVHPPVGQSSPELTLSGLLKAKRQDIVLTPDHLTPEPEVIADGPLVGTLDPLGRSYSEQAVVVGIRSQLSSVAKNFDTLMERAWAETLNLRLRLPELVMGEVYLLPLYEYDEQEMRNNRVRFRTRPVPVEGFIHTFAAISGRTDPDPVHDLYRYDRTALVLADFRTSPPRVFLSRQELVAARLLPHDSTAPFDVLSPRNFASDLVDHYTARHTE